MADLALMRPLDPLEHNLLRRIFEPLQAPEPCWPMWDWVMRHTFREDGVDADDVYAGLPRVHGGVYGLIWHAEGWAQGPRRHETVGLTVAGLSRLTSNPNAARFADWVVGCAAGIARDELAIDAPPSEQAEVYQDFSSHLMALAPTKDCPVGLLPGQAIELWNGERVLPQLSTDNNGGHRVLLEPRLRTYLDVTDLPDYLTRVSNPVVGGPIAMPAPLVSPLALPQTLDYLDLVLRTDERFKWKLLPGKAQFASVAKLSMAVTTVEEFNDRMSGLSDVLDKLAVPKLDEAALGDRTDQPKTINRLGELLTARLPSESGDAVNAAVATLRDAVQIRGGAQHGDAAPKARQAFASLGIGWPVADWDAAWQVVRGRVTAALDAIRVEVQSTHPFA